MVKTFKVGDAIVNVRVGMKILRCYKRNLKRHGRADCLLISPKDKESKENDIAHANAGAASGK